MTVARIHLSSSQLSSIPSLHSIIPSQGIAIIVMSIDPGKRFSMHLIVASLGKVSLHISNISSSPYKQWKTPSHVLSKLIWFNRKLLKPNGIQHQFAYHLVCRFCFLYKRNYFLYCNSQCCCYSDKNMSKLQWSNHN